MYRGIMYKLKFGIRGGIASQEYYIKSKKMAESLAMDITNVLAANEDRDWNGNNPPSTRPETWKMYSNCPIRTWTSSCNFVSLEQIRSDSNV